MTTNYNNDSGSSRLNIHSTPSPFHFKVSHDDVGHTYICGSRLGSGKTVLVNFINMLQEDKEVDNDPE